MSTEAKADPVRALHSAAEQILSVLAKHGEWDDGCYYYEGRAASELQGPIRELEAALAQQAGAGEVQRMDAITEAYNRWPADIRKKLSLHDLRRMTGWTPPAPQPAIPEGVVPASALRDLYRAYVRLLESGRDRICDLGGACDAVDVMEAGDLDLRRAREVIAQHNREGE